RCFDRPGSPPSGVSVRGYLPWERVRRDGSGPPFAPVLEAFSVGLAMARDPVDAHVVHAHTWYASLPGLLIRTLYQIPLVVTLHSLEPLRPWKADQLGTGYRATTDLEKRVVETADRVIAVSEAMRQDVLRLFTIDPARVVLIHNGVDPERYRRTPDRSALSRRGIREPYILFIGRISEQKGIFDLLRAADHFPDHVQLILCAGSPDTPEIAAQLGRAVREHPRIRWIDEMVPVSDVVQLYSHAAVFVCPSIYEPFGVINLEAMSCGTRVVATAVGGITEVVADGETGLLVPPGRPDELARAIVTLLDDPQRARSMGVAGRHRVLTHFSWDRIAERTIEVY